MCRPTIEFIGITSTERSDRLALSLVMPLDRLGVLSCDLSSTICDGGAGGVLSPDGSVSGMPFVGGASCIFFRCPLSPLYTVPSVILHMVRSLEGVDSGWLLGLCLRKESNTDEYDISTTR